MTGCVGLRVGVFVGYEVWGLMTSWTGLSGGVSVGFGVLYIVTSHDPNLNIEIGNLLFYMLSPLQKYFIYIIFYIFYINFLKTFYIELSILHYIILKYQNFY